MLERIEIVGEIDKITFLRYICRGSFAKRRFFHSEEERKISRSKRANPTVKTKQQKMGRGKNRIIYFIKYFFRKIHFATCIRSDQFYEQTCSISKLLFQQSRETFLRSKKKKKKRSPRVDPAFGFISEGKRDRSYLLSFPA